MSSPVAFFGPSKYSEKLRPRSNRIGKKLLRQLARPMRRGLRAKAILAQKKKQRPAHAWMVPMAFLCQLNQQVVFLDVSSGMNWETNAPANDSDFPWLGRFEQIRPHFLQLSCECPLVGNQLLQCDHT